jgi:phosphoesterase RecJ-like protein
VTTNVGRARSRAAAAILHAGAITAVCHENPDADTVGGALAIALIGTLLGKPSEVVSGDRIPANLDFLPGTNRIRDHPALAADLVVVCDAAALERIGPLNRQRIDVWSKSQLLNVDHHISNTEFGDLNLVDPDAAATCQVIAELLPAIGVPLNDTLATLLLTGVMRDTQGFASPATSARTLETVVELVRAGAPLAEIHRRVLTELPFKTMTLWGRLLSSAKRRLRGRVVYTILTPEMLSETGTQQDDADGLVEFMSGARGARVAILFRDLGAELTRVSLRTVVGINAVELVRPFGGGGHALRAGCLVKAPVDHVRDEVLAAVAARLTLPGA